MSSTIRRNYLLEQILFAILFEMPSYSNYKAAKLPRYEASPSISNYCVRYVEKNLPFCDVASFSIKALERASEQVRDYDLQLEEAEEELKKHL